MSAAVFACFERWLAMSSFEAPREGGAQEASLERRGLNENIPRRRKPPRRRCTSPDKHRCHRDTVGVRRCPMRTAEDRRCTRNSSSAQVQNTASTTQGLPRDNYLVRIQSSDKELALRQRSPEVRGYLLIPNHYKLEQGTYAAGLRGTTAER